MSLDPCFSEGRPVDGSIGPDLYIIINLDETYLWDFIVRVALRGKSETIAADNGAWMNQYTLA